MFRVVSVALLSLLLACGGKSSTPAPLAPLPDDGAVPHQDDQAKAPPVQEDREQEKAPPEPPLEPMTLTLEARTPEVAVVAKGKGKKAALRYALVAGATQRFELAVRMKADLSGNQMVMPELHATYAREIQSVADDGTATVRFTLEEISATDVSGATAPAAEVSAALAAFVGLTIDTTITPQGLFGTQTVHLPPGADPQTFELIAPNMVVLPADKVGAGAKWKVTTQSFGNIAATVTSTFKLDSRKGDVAKVSGATTVSAQPQTMNQGGMTAQLEKLEGSDAVKLELDLARAVGVGTIEQKWSMQMNANGQSMTVAMEKVSTVAAK